MRDPALPSAPPTAHRTAEPLVGTGTVSRGTLLLGISGTRQNAAAAAVIDGRLAAFCEQERVTRVRSVRLETGVLPQAAVSAVLERVGERGADVSAFATGEPDAVLPEGLPHRRVEHHRAHAATAAFTSPFENGAVLVCDQHADPPVSVWQFENGRLTPCDWSWEGPGFASLYSECTTLFGFPPRSEHRLEALARLEADGPGVGEQFVDRITYHDGRLRVDPRWKNAVADLVAACRGSRQTRETARVAAGFQRTLGDALVALVADIRRTLPFPNLCLGGGLFFNTYLNTRVVESGVYERVFVPANPGNAGLAAGASLALAAEAQAIPTGPADPFLGPLFAPDVIKATLDNCKLTYDYVSEHEAVEMTVKALLRGQLVGWFQGAMEWGPRSLGHRSILANPFAPHALENLNVFLKQREPHHAYGLSVRLDDAPASFDVPAPSCFMELEYGLLEPTRFRHVLPDGVNRLRVQTIAEETGLFAQLHAAFGAATGTGVLVNTSFNGFHEPMVCSPRDAVRVFYGGGLDMAVLGQFVLRK